MRKKSFKAIVGYWILLIRRIRIFDLLYIYLEGRVHEWDVTWMDAVSIEEYCKGNGEEFIVIEPECQRPVYQAAYYEGNQEEKYLFRAPEIYVACLKNATAVGAAGFVVIDDALLFDAQKFDTEHRIDFRCGPLKRNEGNKSLVSISHNRREIEQAINLCGFAPNNYYHFTVELLSRLDYVKQLQVAEDVPVLIDAVIQQYPQLVQLLETVCEGRRVIYLQEGEGVFVHKLIQPSMNTWMPFNVKKREMFCLSDNLLAESGLQNIRSHVQEYMTKQTDKKIYISRKNSVLCRIANEEKIIPLFQQAGFDIVCTEELSFFEQVELFSTARCVVGATGAALTNVLYCQPEAIVGCLIPKEYDFCIYSTIAHLVGCRTLYFNPDIIFRDKYMAGDRYRVDEQKCKKYIDELVLMSS